MSFMAQYPLRKVVKVKSKSQDTWHLLLECGHIAQHAVPYCGKKAIRAPKSKRCMQCGPTDGRAIA